MTTKMQIPVNKILNPDLPAAININGYRKKSIHGEYEDKLMHDKLEKVVEEIGYLGQYIKSGNADRRSGTKTLIEAIDKLNKDGY